MNFVQLVELSKDGTVRRAGNGKDGKRLSFFEGGPFNIDTSIRCSHCYKLHAGGKGDIYPDPSLALLMPPISQTWAGAPARCSLEI